ncbi:UPF0575 protein C19orf67 homolog isoform X2 [Coregonus clupeaformis]|uniref:UPF0575 protein C19orf67 homolog isoform X2 n=1 Tax=Coregonus clupeaformis TaxID=59861 RepID=UPI001BE0CBE4|nr:UPF0575 protein C19orf67 homolog isoform X2 [Coregonus clupeaformis]
MERGETKNNPESSPDTENVEHLEDRALAPSCGDQRDSTGDAAWKSTSSCHDINMMDQKLRPIEQQLQYLLNKADEFQAHLLYRRDNLQKENFACVVPTFLRTCQPYFTYLESTARSSLPQRTPLPVYIRSRLLDFSQQLCARLEQLVLTYASFDFLSLEEAEPASYFLCYEDVPEEPAEGGDGEGKGETVAIGNVVRMWSIGQWVQTQPEPVTDDIYEWVLCWVPQAQYHRLLCLGGEEPTACSATDCLLGALFSQQSPVESPSPETT